MMLGVRKHKKLPILPKYPRGFGWHRACLCHPGAFAADKEPAPRKTSAADSVLAIYPEDWGLRSRARVPAIILAIWPDGHIVWSKDRIKGEAPYYSGRVDPEQVAALLLGFERDGLFSDKKLNNAHWGPDSHFTTLLIKSGKKQVGIQLSKTGRCSGRKRRSKLKTIETKESVTALVDKLVERIGRQRCTPADGVKSKSPGWDVVDVRGFVECKLKK